jgi:hypothetical protein
MRFQKKYKNVYEIYIYLGVHPKAIALFNLRNKNHKIVPFAIGLKPNI